LRCVAVCCGVLRCVVAACLLAQLRKFYECNLACVAASCSVLQCVSRVFLRCIRPLNHAGSTVATTRVLQCVAVCRSVFRAGHARSIAQVLNLQQSA